MHIKWRMVDWQTNEMFRPGHIKRLPTGEPVVIICFTPPTPGHKASIQVRPLSGQKIMNVPPALLGVKLRLSKDEPRLKLRPRKL